MSSNLALFLAAVMQANQPLDYGAMMARAQQLVPNYEDQELKRQQIEQLRIANDLARRSATIRAAPGYDAKECRRNALGALTAGDLALARDILTVCAP